MCRRHFFSFQCKHSSTTVQLYLLVPIPIYRYILYVRTYLRAESSTTLLRTVLVRRKLLDVQTTTDPMVTSR
jgi:hypothetical protein